MTLPHGKTAVDPSQLPATLAQKLVARAIRKVRYIVKIVREKLTRARVFLTS